MKFSIVLLVITTALLFVAGWLIIAARSLPRIRITYRPRLFLQMVKEIRFFNTLSDCWKSSLHHTRYLILPEARSFSGRDSGAILNTLYQTFHPAQIINQMQKIGHRFLRPLTSGRKRAFLKKVIKAVSCEVPEARPALQKAYWKTRWFKDWNTTIYDFFRHIHIETERDPLLQPKLEILWLKCSQVVMEQSTESMFIPDDLELQIATSRNRGNDAEYERFKATNDIVQMVRNGLAGGIWYVRYRNNKSLTVIESINSSDLLIDIPQYLNEAESTHFGHDIESMSFLNGENYNGYIGFPVAYFAGELYRQYLLLKQDKTDIKTSLTFITIDAAGVGGGMFLLSGLIKGSELDSTGVLWVTYRGVKMLVKEVKKLIFRNAKKKYEKFLRKREKVLFRSASNMMENIDIARNKEQNKLDNHPYNQNPVKPDETIFNHLIDSIKNNILEDMEKMHEIDRVLQTMNTRPVYTAQAIIIQYRLWRIRSFVRNNITFLRELKETTDKSALTKLLLKSWLLPVAHSSLLADRDVSSLNSFIRYNHYYMLGMVNHVFCFYGLLQQAFASLAEPISEATKCYDKIAESWIDQTRKAQRKLEVKAAQVNRFIPKSPSGRKLPLWEYRNILHRKNGKWTYGTTI